MFRGREQWQQRVRLRGRGACERGAGEVSSQHSRLPYAIHGSATASPDHVPAHGVHKAGPQAVRSLQLLMLPSQHPAASCAPADTPPRGCALRPAAQPRPRRSPSRSRHSAPAAPTAPPVPCSCLVEVSASTGTKALIAGDQGKQQLTITHIPYMYMRTTFACLTRSVAADERQALAALQAEAQPRQRHLAVVVHLSQQRKRGGRSRRWATVAN